MITRCRRHILPFTADYAEKDAAESIRSYWVKTFKGMMDKTNPEYYCMTCVIEI
jgi:hypothetical protein